MTEPKVVRLADTEIVKFGPDAYYQPILGDDAGSTPIRTGIQTSEPGYVAPMHSHPYLEVLHILDGTAEAWIEGGEDRKVVLKKGDTIALAPNVPHTFRVVGDQVLRLLGTHASPHRIVNYRDGNETDPRGLPRVERLRGRTPMSSSAEHAQTPRGVNHLVLNVRDLEESHRFWTEIIGFRCVAELKPKPGRTMQMRFYSGVNERGQVSHHDLALAQIPDGASLKPEPWAMGPRAIGVNHVAICYPDRDAWLKQVAFLKSRGVPIHLRIDHGMTHSVYISDPNGHGIEVLYELPREVWESDIEGAQNYAERLPPDDDASLVDSTDYPKFGAAAKS